MDSQPKLGWPRNYPSLPIVAVCSIQGTSQVNVVLAQFFSDKLAISSLLKLGNCLLTGKNSLPGGESVLEHEDQFKALSRGHRVAGEHCNGLGQWSSCLASVVQLEQLLSQFQVLSSVTDQGWSSKEEVQTS
eukprot:6460797-Amphidinium_carterae.2